MPGFLAEILTKVAVALVEALVARLVWQLISSGAARSKGAAAAA